MNLGLLNKFTRGLFGGLTTALRDVIDQFGPIFAGFLPPLGR